jgi:hypothetical protein
LHVASAIPNDQQFVAGCKAQYFKTIHNIIFYDL